MKTKSQWCVLVNGENAKLVRISSVAGRVHMEQIDQLVNQWQAPETEPPTSLSTPTSNHSYGSLGHLAEEHQRQYANHLATWIERIIRERQMDDVIVFASPRFHGWLRKAYSPATVRHVRERMGDFAHPDVSQLAHHPAIEALLT